MVAQGHRAGRRRMRCPLWFTTVREAEEAGADGLSCGELFGWVCSSEEADPSVDVVG